MKAPQERKTKKRISDRELGYPDIVLDGDENTLSLTEMGEDKWPPVFRGREEIELLRDYCDAWLEYDEEVMEE